jgi:hypothetical protein
MTPGSQRRPARRPRRPRPIPGTLPGEDCEDYTSTSRVTGKADSEYPKGGAAWRSTIQSERRRRARVR